jgi:hypothetical protein
MDDSTAVPIELTACCICKRLVDEQTDAGHLFVFPAAGRFGCWVAYTCEDCDTESRALFACAQRMKAGSATDADTKLFKRSEHLRREIVALEQKNETLASAWAGLLPLESVTDELVEWGDPS